MTERRCCVCDRVLAEDARPLGARYFCRTHRASALGALRFDWTRSGLIEVAVIALFVWTVSLLGGNADSGALPTSLPAGLLLAVVPTVVWLVYIYRLDRVEPEPWPLVFGVLVAGGLLCWAVVGRVSEDVFQLSEWQHRSTTAEALAAILLSGTLQQLCTYAAVRYTVYLTDEFDDPLDGIVYATAAALGVATVINVDFVLRGNGVLPLEGATAIASSALVHVAAAAVLGYGMGRARFDPRRRELWMGVGFAGSVLVNGTLTHLADILGIDGADVLPWATLLVSLVTAVVVLLSIDRLMVRLVFRSLARPRPTEG